MDKKSAYISSEIILNAEIAPGIYLMKLKGNYEGCPGQFYMLRAWERYPLLSRPLSICDKDEESITFLYQVVGKGTTHLSKLKPGEMVQILGPLGQGFPLDHLEDKKIALVCGGIGIAPMLYLAKNLKIFDFFAGFRNEPYFVTEFQKRADFTQISSETGHYGEKGYITQFIPDEYDVVFACGPNPMMQSLKSLKLKARVYLSLEAHMACGIGACLGCAVKTVNGVKRVCHEGPVFLAEEVEIDA